MDIDNYKIYIFLINLISIYILYKYFCVFYDRENVKKPLAILGYSLNVVINTIVYLYFGKPVIIMISSILCIFIISFAYSSNLKKNIITTISIVLIYILIEIIIFALFGKLHLIDILDKIQYSSIFLILIINLIEYLVAIFLANYKNIKNTNVIPSIYFLNIFATTFMSVFLIFVILINSGDSESLVLVSCLTVLLINFIVLYIYDKVIYTFSENALNESLKQRNTIIENELILMQQNMKHLQILKHDIKNHLIALMSYYNNNQLDEYNVYAEKLFESLESENKYISTGNSTIDSIINYKLKELYDINVKINFNINDVSEVKISNYTLISVLGNLLDNAIEGLKTVEENRVLFIMMIYSKNTLIIEMDNTFDGVVIKHNQNISSRKNDKQNHGLGIKSIKNAISKYNGDMKIDYNDNLFSVNITLYEN